MNAARKRTLLFLICAAVLLGAGWAWGYASGFNRFNSFAVLMDRETLDIGFFSRLLHYADNQQPQKVHAEIRRRLEQEVAYAHQLMASAKPGEVSPELTASLTQADAALDPRLVRGAPQRTANSDRDPQPMLDAQGSAPLPPPPSPLH